MPIRCREFLDRHATALNGPTRITKADHRKLSAHAQHLTRFLVADSSDELRTGYTVTPPR